VCGRTKPARRRMDDSPTLYADVKKASPRDVDADG
jgi:hypothetical protein